MAKSKKQNDALSRVATEARGYIDGIGAQDTAFNRARQSHSEYLDTAAETVSRVRALLVSPKIIDVVRTIFPGFPTGEDWTRIMKSGEHTEAETKQFGRYQAVRRLLLRWDALRNPEKGVKAVPATVPASLVYRLIRTFEGYGHKAILAAFWESLASEDRGPERVTAIQAKLKTAKAFDMPKAPGAVAADVAADGRSALGLPEVSTKERAAGITPAMKARDLRKAESAQRIGALQAEAQSTATRSLLICKPA